ncbi:MAG: protein translocase subunit SecD [Bdellovibrionales bacterium]
MIESLKTRMGIIVAVILVSAYIFAPNLMSKEKAPSWLPAQSLVYGLDIQGGLHLVLGVDTPGVLEEKLSRLGDLLKEELNKKNPGSVSAISFKKDGVAPQIELTGNTTAINSYISTNYAGILQNVVSEGGVASFQYFETYVNSIKKQIVVQAIEVIRNRIDSFGVSEPYIAAQGTERIVVQLPGIDEKDYQQAKDLINRAARLEKMIVSSEMTVVELNQLVKEAEVAGSYTIGTKNEGGLKYIDYVKRLNQDLKGKLPAQTELVFQKLDNVTEITDGKSPVLVKNDMVFSGDKIADAFVGVGEYGQPVVNFSVASDGRGEFAKLTGDNVDKPMAIILDKVVMSAPNIGSRLREGGVITLGGGQDIQQEAEFLTNVLRAGALPAALEQLEERTVGPTLGADSIEAGKKAGLVGLLFVLVFMIGWYRLAGAVAGFALAVNIFLILAILTSLGATLTLPGIAGIVLTVGMAVDANVIIFERIKEELFKGSGIRAAIKDGFGHAISAIFDANITTAAVCLVLMFYGTGPIKGFAVTLIWGIATSMFTAIFLTRTVVELLVSKGVTSLLPAKRRA